MNILDFLAENPEFIHKVIEADKKNNTLFGIPMKYFEEELRKPYKPFKVPRAMARKHYRDTLRIQRSEQ